MQSYPECPSRQKLVILAATGDPEVIQQCAEPSCARVGSAVTPYDCLNCPVRLAVGSRHKARAAKVAALPPPKVFSVAKTPLESDWPECRDRASPVVAIECCGKVETIRRCKSKQAPTHGQAVTIEQCIGCKFKR